MLIGFTGWSAISALFWTAVINGFLAPMLLLAIMLVANNPSIMRDRVNGRVLNVIGWATTVAVSAAAIGLVLTWNSA